MMCVTVIELIEILQVVGFVRVKFVSGKNRWNRLYTAAVFNNLNGLLFFKSI